MKWFIIFFVAALIGYFLWIKGHLDSTLPEKLVPMAAGDTKNAAAPETTDAPPPEKVELKNVNPDLKSTGRIYTETDVRRVSEKAEKDSPKKNTFTNADLKKYKERPGKPDIEQARKDIQWAEEPEKKPKKKQ